ncbi:hypothetical protein EYF80_020119 [Liparis tanakae]|uniref:Uncharacterized protein n=1 Tax=Liparis tanakae TaxID=230148 RepID=A0A4Z2HUX7_9TELE|nr:hypothetical protein EYF80_020119 [Liparis tanakae]
MREAPHFVSSGLWTGEPCSAVEERTAGRSLGRRLICPQNTAFASAFCHVHPPRFLASSLCFTPLPSLRLLFLPLSSHAASPSFIRLNTSVKSEIAA